MTNVNKLCCATNIDWPNTCSECNQSSCINCSAACFECVDAWRHKDCAMTHIVTTKHWGQLNDLEYLVDSVLHPAKSPQDKK